MLEHKEALQMALQDGGSGVVLGEIIKGGVVSQVYGGAVDGEPVVVKHTGDFAPDYPSPLFISRAMQDVDVAVLERLAGSPVRVPRVVEHHPDISTTVMEDLTQEGFAMLSTAIVERRVPLETGQAIGHTLATLVTTARSWARFDTVETAKSSMDQRGIELRMAYPNDDTGYRQLEARHVDDNRYWTWADGHPKNILHNANGEIALIDFGESYFGDQKFILPNFLAQIAVYDQAGYFDHGDGRKYMGDCIGAYAEVEPIPDERLFCQYLGMETLHRSQGRWIEGVTTIGQKLGAYGFGLRVYENATSVNGLLNMMR
jgi:tRNA A-37 threonylcarbamoyl transferase component Bud32